MTTRGVLLTFAAAALAFSACATVAPPPSDPIVELGMVELGERHYESARSLFHAADVERPTAETAFFEGATLNRLGHFELALERLERASLRGLRHPELEFETGWSMLAIGRWHAAIARLERYEAQRPGRAKTSELLGRAYVGAWHPERAERVLQEAMRRDPTVTPAALFYLAVLERSRNDAKATQGYIGALLESAPEARLALIVPKTAAPTAVATATDVAPARTPVAHRTVRRLFANVREGPGTKAPILTVVKAGVRLAVVGEQGGWYHVRLEDGRDGWIAASVTAPAAPGVAPPAATAVASDAQSNGSARVDPAAAVESALTRFVLDPNPALLVRFDAETAPLPALRVERARMRWLRLDGAATSAAASRADAGLTVSAP